MIVVRRAPELELHEAQERAATGESRNAWLAKHLAKGEVIVLGTAPREEWRGYEQVLQLELDAHAANVQAGIDGGPADTHVVEGYEAGDTGWIVSQSRFRFDDGTSVPIRVVAIYVRDTDNGWINVFRSTQLLVANELLAPGSPLRTAD